MQKSIIKKGLVAGIIVLFLGIGVQPAFAIDISNVSPSDNIEDCNCQVDDNDIVRVKSLLTRVERSLNRVETLTRLIPILSKDNSDVEVEYQKLVNDIDLFKEIYDDIENNIPVDGRPVCDFLSNILWKLFDIAINTDFSNLNLMSIVILVFSASMTIPISILYFAIFMCQGIP